MGYEIKITGESRSFPVGDAFLDGSVSGADIVLHLGTPLERNGAKTAILVELDSECLGVHTGEDSGREGSNVLGFARYCNGNDAPSQLIELVRQPATEKTALDAAKAMFEAAGFTVVVCADQVGRIIDRLVRPKYNDALRFLDEGLAQADDMDLICKMGLGYRDGPIERAVRGGLARHYDLSDALLQATGQTGYVPARRAAIAKARENS